MPIQPQTTIFCYKTVKKLPSNHNLIVTKRVQAIKAKINYKDSIINTQLNINLPVQNKTSLTDEQRIIFMEVIAESLRVSQRSHLFNWLQGGFQYLVGHEVMIFGIKSQDNESYQFEYFASTRYFSDDKFNDVVNSISGLASQAIKIWNETWCPYFVSNQESAATYSSYTVTNADAEELKQSELNNFIVHGFGDNNSKISSVVILARLHPQPHAVQANMLELIMPHLHCALLKVTSSKHTYVLNHSTAFKTVTKRESEILQWLSIGKTNWEISAILEISPLTVKNHVQNLLRKLDVQNRGQAVVKAAKFGLIRMVK